MSPGSKSAAQPTETCSVGSSQLPEALTLLDDETFCLLFEDWALAGFGLRCLEEKIPNLLASLCWRLPGSLSDFRLLAPIQHDKTVSNPDRT